MLMPMLRFSNGRLLSSQVFFEEYKPYTLIDIPLYEKNENKFFHFSSFQKWTLFPLNGLHQNQLVDFH